MVRAGGDDMHVVPCVAGELGFEPRQTESESVVLPLHHSPKLSQDINDIRDRLTAVGEHSRMSPWHRGPSTRSIPLLASTRRPRVGRTAHCPCEVSMQCLK